MANVGCLVNRPHTDKRTGIVNGAASFTIHNSQFTIHNSPRSFHILAGHRHRLDRGAGGTGGHDFDAHDV